MGMVIAVDALALGTQDEREGPHVHSPWHWGRHGVGGEILCLREERTQNG